MTDPRQAAYDAVFTYIRSQPRDFLPTTVVGRNAMIWHAVHAALDAVGIPKREETTDPAVVEEAVRQMDADPTQPHTGLVIQPYTGHGLDRWLFRCWGTDDGCDGWLGLGHYTRQSAERERDRHLAEDHKIVLGPCPACQRADQAGLSAAELHTSCKEQRGPVAS